LIAAITMQSRLDVTYLGSLPSLHIGIQHPSRGWRCLANLRNHYSERRFASNHTPAGNDRQPKLR
jgi:hypothetical protein